MKIFDLINNALERMWSDNYEEVLTKLLNKKYTKINSKYQYDDLIESLAIFWGDDVEKMFTRLGEIVGEGMIPYVSKNLEGTKSDKFHIIVGNTIDYLEEAIAAKINVLDSYKKYIRINIENCLCLDGYYEEELCPTDLIIEGIFRGILKKELDLKKSEICYFCTNTEEEQFCEFEIYSER